MLDEDDEMRDDDATNGVSDADLMKRKVPQVEYNVENAIVLHEDKQYYPSAEQGNFRGPLCAS